MKKMRRILSMLVVAIMLVGLLAVTTAEETELTEPAAEQVVVIEPAAEESQAEEAPAAEEPKTEEAPAAEEPAAEEAPVEEEPAAEEPAAEEAPAEEAPVVFSGKLRITVENKDKLELGGVAKLKAAVTDANLGYKLSWQKKTLDKEGKEIWVEFATGEKLELAITEDAILNGEYRLVLVANDGTELIAEYQLPKALLETEEPEAEEPAAEEPEAEEPVEEEPAAEEPAEEEPAEEEPAAEEPVEEPVEEEPAAEEPVEEEPVEEEPAAEEPAEEEPAEEEPAAEEPAAEEPVEEEPAAEEPVEEEPAEEEPVAEEAAAEEEPVAEEPAVEEPAVEEPAEEEPAVEEPAEEEPAVEEPIVFNFGEKEEAAEEEIISEDEPQQATKVSDYKFVDDNGTVLDLSMLQLTTVAVKGEVDVRIDDNGLSPIFVTLEEGAEIQIIRQNGDWYEVIIGDEIGYIYKDALDGSADEYEVDPEEVLEAEAPEMKVTIFTSRRTVMTLGEPVYLTSKLEGFDGYEITLQWQCDKGEGFEDVEGANGETYEFEASAETLGWGWKLLVTAQ